MFSIVYTTTENREEAKIIASRLVEQKLAACVNMHPIDSIYEWKGKIEEEREIALSIKTVSENVEAVTSSIKEMHTYDLPAIISWNIEGEKEYLEWIRESTNQ